jgi:hypothetical protein
LANGYGIHTHEQKKAYIALPDSQIAELEDKTDRQLEMLDALIDAGHSTEAATKAPVLLLNALDAIQQDRAVVSKTSKR